jgi:acyl-CoA thioesterase I
MTREQWILVGIFLVAAAGVAYFLYKSDDTRITNYPSEGTDIIALGDSLVAGYGASKGRDFVSLLSNTYDVPIVNLGRDGDTTKDVLARINELDKYDPKIVILLVGGNDYLKRLDMDEAFKNIEEIIKEIHKRGSVVLLLGLKLHPLLGNFDKEFNDLRNKYHTAYVPDVLDGILGNPKLLSDNIHPNDQGYKLMAQKIAPVFENILE